MPMSENMDMLKMQEEALRRAREMQARSRLPREENPSAGKNSSARSSSNRQRSVKNENLPKPEPVEKKEITPTEKEEILAQEEPGLLSTLLEDKDKTLILTLLVLLSEDGENVSHELLFGLMFLLM